MAVNWREIGRDVKSSVKDSTRRDNQRGIEERAPLDFGDDTEVFSYEQALNNREMTTLADKFKAAVVEFVNETGRTNRIQEEMEELVATEELTLLADCYKFILDASSLILETKEDTVRIELDNRFKNVVDEVVKNRRFKNFEFRFIRRPVLTENFIIEIIRKGVE